MGVYIKDMEMPKSCYSCPLRKRNGIDIVCPVAQERFSVADVNILFYRLDSCPLVEIPEPHGRLGDLDRLEQMFADIDNAPYSGFDGTEPFYSAEDAAQIIRLAPTVIPASEEG